MTGTFSYYSLNKLNLAKASQTLPIEGKPVLPYVNVTYGKPRVSKKKQGPYRLILLPSHYFFMHLNLFLMRKLEAETLTT